MWLRGGVKKTDLRRVGLEFRGIRCINALNERSGANQGYLTLGRHSCNIPSQDDRGEHPHAGRVLTRLERAFEWPHVPLENVCTTELNPPTGQEISDDGLVKERVASPTFIRALNSQVKHLKKDDSIVPYDA